MLPFTLSSLVWTCEMDEMSLSRHSLLPLLALVLVPLASPFGRLRTSDRLEQAAKLLGDAAEPPSPPGESGATFVPLPTAEELAKCMDKNPECARWAKGGECEANPEFMLHECPAGCQQCQSENCRDKNAVCASWAASGECKANHAFMLKECPFACKVCHINFKEACRRDPAMAPAAVPGTIDATIERALREFPAFRPRVLHREPWVIEFQSFLTETEADHIIRTGGHNFERSLAGDGVTPVRTSSTSWCNVESCLSDGLFQVMAADGR
jgi:hypothetical protein